MANIPVERTSAGVPWWTWLLGALLLGLLALFLFGAFDDDDDTVVADTDRVEVVTDDADRVAVVDEPDDVNAADVDAAGSLDRVAVTALDMSNLYVTRVTGDKTFFVAADANSTGNETLVILNEKESPDVPGIEGQVDVNPGQRLSLARARMEPLGNVDLTGMGLSDADASKLSPTTEVIRVDDSDVSILEADMQNVEVGN